jgi:alanine racemase
MNSRFRPQVSVNLSRVRKNAIEIAHKSKVPVLAVIKADAYGTGAVRISRALADVVLGFCTFSLEEAIAADLKSTGRPTLVIAQPTSLDPNEFLSAHAHPAVTNVEQATALRKALPAVCVDTGMQRFACPADQLDAVIKAGQCVAAFTHALRIEQVHKLVEWTRDYDLKRHAAGSSLMYEPGAALDAVRPGIALYDGAVRITTRILETHQTKGPAGYTGFTATMHGVIAGGYSHGLRPGVCLINGQTRRILEVGMQSSFVEIDSRDKAGDEVVLFGDSLKLVDASRQSHISAHEMLVRLAFGGEKAYVE